MILKIFKFISIISLIVGFSCSPYRNVGVISDKYYIDNNNFRSLDFVKSFNSLLDSNSITIYNYSRFSPDRKYHIATKFKSFPKGGQTGKCTSYLYKDSLKQGKIKWTLIEEELFWLDSALIFFGYNGANHPYSRKIRTNLNELSTNYIPTGGQFLFLGRTNEKLFYETLNPYQSINNITIPKAHSIISIGNNDIQIEKISNDIIYYFPQLSLK